MAARCAPIPTELKYQHPTDICSMSAASLRKELAALTLKKESSLWDNTAYDSEGSSGELSFTQEDVLSLNIERFFAAAKQGETAIISEMLETALGPTLLSAKLERSRTALLAASRFGHPGVVSVLLSHGVDVDEQNDAGVSPLMVAAAYGHLKCVRQLLKHGASLSLCDKTGRSALDWAIKSKCTRVVEAMEVHLAGDAALLFTKDTVSPYMFYFNHSEPHTKVVS
mmetsp:Transcript_45959/g.99926  ORF Transcript_45959/g.99926 Transcript_45959/m.99926 type:complete len:226 (-) Transcript_45959:386-1063(-)